MDIVVCIQNILINGLSSILEGVGYDGQLSYMGYRVSHIIYFTRERLRSIWRIGVIKVFATLVSLSVFTVLCRK